MNKKDFKKTTDLRKKPHYIPSNPLGGPSKYQEDYPQKVEKYLTTVGDGTCKMPKRCDVALLFNVAEETLVNWGKDHETFGAVMRRVDLLQKSQLSDDGMYGGKEVNPQMAKFLLSANHGMTETTRNEITGKDGASIPIKVTIEIIKSDETKINSQE